METINNIIDNRNKQRKIIRCTYAPFKMEIAINKFQQIGYAFCDGHYEINDDNRDIIKTLISYIQGFQNGINNEYGILLQGPTGCGKTLIMRILDEFIDIDDVKYIFNGSMVSFHWKYVYSKKLVSEFQNGGYEAIEKYAHYHSLFIDDIGSEAQEGVHFGNKENIIGYILEERYESGKMTHATTNFTDQAFKDFYGDRVYSRSCKMFNKLTLKGKDFRQC